MKTSIQSIISLLMLTHKPFFCIPYVLLSFFISVSGPSTAQSWYWAKSMVGDSSEEANSLAIDLVTGDTYTTGSFEGTTDFDPGIETYNLTATGYKDIFLSKLDADGNFSWGFSMGGDYEDMGRSVAFCPGENGGVYITGNFYGDIDFDPGPEIFHLSSNSYENVFIAKYDTSGNFIWAKVLGGNSGFTSWSSLVLDAAGDVYLTGAFNLTVDFDPGAGVYNLTAVGGYDIFLMKLDSDGNFIWAKGIGGTSHENVYAITFDPTGSGNVYTTGYFRGTTDFDPGPGTFNLTAVGYQDIFISRLDGQGNFVWAKAMAGSNSSFGLSLTVDTTGSGEVYTTGSFQGTVDFDPGPDTFYLTSPDHFVSWPPCYNYCPCSHDCSYTIYANTIFISKLDRDGNFLWAKAMGGTYNDGGFGFSIALDPTGNHDVFTTGSMVGNVDFDPGMDSVILAGDGMFISRLNASGDFVSAEVILGATGKSLQFDAEGNRNVTGYFTTANASFGSTTLTNSLTLYYDDWGTEYYHCCYPEMFVARSGPCTGIVSNTADYGGGSLREIISCSASGATITFDDALIDQTITLTSGEILINKNLTLAGPGINDLTISGNHSGRIFNLPAGNSLHIENLALKQGSSVIDGGAVYTKGHLTLENVLLQNNLQNGIPRCLTLLSPGRLTVEGNVQVKN